MRQKERKKGGIKKEELLSDIQGNTHLRRDDKLGTIMHSIVECGQSHKHSTKDIGISSHQHRVLPKLAYH